MAGSFFHKVQWLWKHCLFVLVIAPAIAFALYEDQVGLFDWQKRLIGVPHHIVSVPGSQKVIFGTDRAVIAAVDVNTGEHAWRRILESGDGDQPNDNRYPVIDAMWLTGHGGRSIAVLTFGTVIRMFDTESGKLKLEFPLVSEKLDTPSLFSSKQQACECHNRALYFVTAAAESEVVIADANGVVSKLSLLPPMAAAKGRGDVQTPVRWRYEATLGYRPVFIGGKSSATLIVLMVPSACSNDRDNDKFATKASKSPAAVLVEIVVETGAAVQSVMIESSPSLVDSECKLIHTGAASKQATLLLCIGRITGEVWLLDTHTGKIISSSQNADAVFGTKCGYAEKSIGAVDRDRADSRRSYMNCLADDCREIVFTCSGETSGVYVLRISVVDETMKYEAEILDETASAAFVARKISTSSTDGSNAPDDGVVLMSAATTGNAASTMMINFVSASQILSGNKNAVKSMKPLVSHAAFYGAPQYIYAWQTSKLGVTQPYYAVVTRLDVVLLFRGTELIWARHEGLASIVSAVITELPQTTSEELIENEFLEASDTSSNSSQPSSSLSAAQLYLNPWMPQSIAHAFIRRLFAQYLQLKHFVFHFQDHITSLLSMQILPTSIITRTGGDTTRVFKQQSAAPLFQTAPKKDTEAKKLLQRNQFDTHKLIVAVTRSGGLYGLESKHGSIVWFNSVHPKLLCIPEEHRFGQQQQRTNVPDGCKYHLFLQRINARPPYSHKHAAIIIGEAQVGRPSEAVFVGAWQQFNPVSGQFITRDVELLPAAVSSAGLLPFRLDAEQLQPVFVLDTEFAVHVLPPTPATRTVLSDSASYVHRFIQNDLFLTTIVRQASPSSNGPVSVVGCKPRFNGTNIHCIESWSHELSGADNAHLSSRVVAVAQKSAHEVAYSDARIIADERLLYKYINPNLLLIITEVRDSSTPAHSGSSVGGGAATAGGTILHAVCIDMITGQVIVSNVHKRASRPVTAVVSENFIVYTYWSERMRNTEVAVLDFYLGERKLVGTNDEYERAFSNYIPNSHTNFSTSSSPSSSPWLSSLVLGDYKPIIEQRVYNLRAHVRALGVSQTARGITHKSLYFGLSNGAILELPKMVVDARRPIILDAKAREEGLAPYTPELPLAPQQYVNYNRSIMQIAQLHCAPAGLESTALLFASGGLDLFFTQLAPSQRFDVLKDDFDYWMLVLALLALVAASVISRRIAHRKVLLEVWK